MSHQHGLILFTIPSLVVLTAVLFFPLGYSLYLSFFDYYLPTPTHHFVGIKQYVSLLSDARLWQSLKTTFQIVIFAVVLQFLIGLLLAFGLYKLTAGAKAFTVLLFLPHILTPVIIGLLLRWMFMNRWGLIDIVLSGLGIPSPDWFGHPIWAKVSIILADSWQYTPFITLVLYAGLQSLPQEPVEAALIDGTSGWQLLWHILLPGLKPLIVFVLAIRTMDAFRIFDSIYVLTGGGPGTATETVSIYTYTLAFRLLQIGKASALGVITLVLLTGIVGGIIFWIYRHERGEF
jgi:multiple sugar transport system permease protein